MSHFLHLLRCKQRMWLALATSFLIISYACPVLGQSSANSFSEVTTYYWDADQGWIPHATWENTTVGTDLKIMIDAWSSPPEWSHCAISYDNIYALGDIDPITAADGLLDDFDDGVIGSVWFSGSAPGVMVSESNGVLTIEAPAGGYPGIPPDENRVGWVQTGLVVHGDIDVSVDFDLSDDFHDLGAGCAGKIFLTDADDDALEIGLRTGYYESNDVPFGDWIGIERTSMNDLTGRIRIARNLIQGVSVDLKPGGYPNTINCLADRQIVSVAILTTEDFDASTVDHSTVVFEGAEETHRNRLTGQAVRHEEDVDLDGDADLVFHFRYGDTSLSCGSIQAWLTGITFDGQTIRGSDEVRMIGPGSGKALSADESPGRFALGANYPNPLNPTTVISYELPEECAVSLRLYDNLGRETRLLDSGIKPPGRHQVTLNADGLSSGVYFYRLEAGHFSDTRQLLVVK